MKIRKSSRVMALVLALMMIVPLIGVPTFAEDASNVIWEENFNDASAIGDVTSGAPSSASIATTVEKTEDKALQLDVKTADANGKYYLWKGTSSGGNKELTVISTADNTLKASIKEGEVTYYVKGTLPSGNTTTTPTFYTDEAMTSVVESEISVTYGTSTADLKSYVLCDSRYREAKYGGTNVAKPAVLKDQPSIAYGTKKNVLSMDIYLSENLYEASGIGARMTYKVDSKNYNFELFEIIPKGTTTATFQQHENGVRSVGTAVTVNTGEWFTVDIVMDLAAGTKIDVYVNGEYAFTAAHKSNTHTNITLNAGSLQFQFDRGQNPDDLKGYFQLDNIAIYEGDQGYTDKYYYSVDFDNIPAGILTTANGSSASPVASDDADLHAEEGTAITTSKTYFNVQDGYLHMPFWGYGKGTAAGQYGGNSDQFYKITHREFTPADGLLEINFKLRPSNETGKTSQTQFRIPSLRTGYVNSNTLGTSQGWYSLFDLNVNASNCTLGGKLGHKTGNVPILNVWNDVKIVIDMVEGYYWIYFNGALAGYTFVGENLYIPANGIRLNNLLKTTSYSTDIDTANYIDLDDISIGASTDSQFIDDLPVRDEFEFVTPFTKVEKEGNAEFIRVPWIQTSTATNYDKYLLAKNAAFSATDYTKISFKIRPNYNETVGGAPTIEFQFTGYGFTDEEGKTHTNGSWYSFGQYGLQTGDKKTSYGTIVDGVEGLQQNEWNDMVFLFNPKDGSSITYINGELYAYNNAYTAQYYDGGWKACPNSTNYTVEANKFVVAKCNKTDGYATTADATDYSYVDIDALTFETVTLVDMYKGILETVDGASIRLGDAPNANANATTTGIRFATELDMAKLEELITVFGEENVQFGTLIAPSDYLTEGNLTAALGAGKYLDVQANYGHYYAVDQDDETTHFVGSITNVFEANLGRKFSARGYITVTLTDGSEVTLYGDIVERSVKQVATAALADPNASWTPEETDELTGYTNVADWVAPAN